MVDDARRWGPRLLEDGTYLDRPRPSWRYPAVVGAVGLAALGPTALAFEDERWTIAAVAIGALFVVLAPLVWVQSRVTYCLDEEALTVRVGLQRQRMPYGRIRDVRQLRGALPTLG